MFNAAALCNATAFIRLVTLINAVAFSLITTSYADAAETIPPLTTPSPIMGTYATTQTVTLTCNDGTGSGCAATHYCLGTGCTPTTGYSAPISIAASTELRFYSSDQDGNIEQIRTHSYSVDPTRAYSFERRWPELPQSLYFQRLFQVAIDSKGNFYAIDSSSALSRIQKFDSNGAFITSWGSTGSGNGQFNSPQCIALDASDNIYISDYGNNRIQKFTPDGAFIASFGSYGSGNGQFNGPSGITAAANGNVYVTDGGNNRIQKFSPDGTFMAVYASPSSGNGVFSSPNAVAVDPGGNIYVSTNFRIQKFDSNWNYLTQWGIPTGGYQNGEFNGVFNLVLAPDGNIHVADLNNNRIQTFTADGTFVRTFGGQYDPVYDMYADGNLFQAYGVGVDSSGNIFVTDSGNYRVQKFTSTGTFIANFSSHGNGNGQLYNPAGIAFDSGGNFYVGTLGSPSGRTADSLKSRIQKFTPDGTFISSFGTNGTGNGQFTGLYDIAVDASDNVYAVDGPNHRIQKFDANGNYLTKWGSNGSSNGQFSGPVSIAVDSTNSIYIVDKGNNRIQKFDSSGTFLSAIYASGGGSFNHLQGIAIDSADNIYVADSWNHRIQKFNSAGAFVAIIGSNGNGNGQFNEPGAISCDKDNNLYVVDSKNNRIQKFDSNGNYLTQWGAVGSANGQMIFTASGTPLGGIAVDSSGNVYVADTDNNRVQKFKPVLSDIACRLQLGSNCQSSITSAYSAASNGDTIKLLATTYAESLELQGVANVTLRGGYADGTYTTIGNGVSTIMDLTVRTGSVTLENLKLTGLTIIADSVTANNVTIQ